MFTMNSGKIATDVNAPVCAIVLILTDDKEN